MVVVPNRPRSRSRDVISDDLLIAVRSIPYLAIKVHGELKENDPVSGEEYDVVASLVHEVDGRAFLGKSIAKDGKMDVEDGHNHEEISGLSVDR